MAVGSHTDPMLPIVALLSDTATRRALVGARAQDPVVPDHRSEPAALQLGRFSAGMEVHPVPSSRWRVGRFSDGTSRTEAAALDERRAA
jgi:hypothetical protein